ncbi:transglutaminase family protein [Microlunatus antarcticus]|uniref:Transglutaminase-like putative cysteine protease n=1 Tax=Microlunatus antarcticus TaxID=53388 RepID=A0A7W5P652_9ACTN|nr:transglutaminase-like putative cysteine protease [Microlunatus antarcticus]
MKRTVTSHLDLGLSAPARLVFAIAGAQGSPFASESLALSVDGVPVVARELVDFTGNRMHVLDAIGSKVLMDYEAVVDGESAPPPVDDFDLITYLRPSRYCESDSLAPTAAAEFSGTHGAELLDAVSTWVSGILTYVPGSSLPTDGAVRTFLGRQGVCRDYAHLCIALLRAMNVPARLAAVFAPGLSPMEYHAVCEAYLEPSDTNAGGWYVVDATRLAPRQSLLRVATGRDAADTAFLTNYGGTVTLDGLEVTAVVDDFGTDDGSQLIQLR